MVIEIKENIIEIKAEQTLIKDFNGNTFMGICFKNNGQKEEELKEQYKEISKEEYEEIKKKEEEELKRIEEENKELEENLL